MDHHLDYVVEKAFRRFPDEMGEELLFEMAVCMDCAMDMRKQLSQESRQSVQSFFLEKVEERRQQNQSFSREELMNQCLLTGEPLNELQEYQIYAHCRGEHLSPMGGAYMLGGPVIEQIQDMLSKKTRDELQRFADENLGGPPELRKLFAGGDLVGL